MAKWLFCAATPTSGLRHRFAMLSALKHFADSRRYSVCMLWGMTRGVSFCRFEELLAPIPRINIVNISAEQLSEIATHARSGNTLMLGKHSFPVFRGTIVPMGSFFSWDLANSRALARKAHGGIPLILATSLSTIRAESLAYARAHGISDRLGIRVRVEEHLQRNRKPHRIRAELDGVLRSIIRIPWHTKVFIVTDSEYIQQMLASHFTDARFFHKEFDLHLPSGRYVHRQDKRAMVTFLKEINCLCDCKRIVNIGGFLNDFAVRDKIIDPPYTEAVYLGAIRRSAI